MFGCCAERGLQRCFRFSRLALVERDHAAQVIRKSHTELALLESREVDVRGIEILHSDQAFDESVSSAPVWLRCSVSARSVELTAEE